jgi:F-type H+-transporting ATPase subunit epsilon
MLDVQVVSPERILWSGEAAMVSVRTLEGGDIAFLTGHAPFVGALDVGPAMIRPETGDDVGFAVHGGFVEVSDNRVSILSDVAEKADDIDPARARAAKERAEAAVRTAEEDDEAKHALRRAEVRLRVAGVAE